MKPLKLLIFTIMSILMFTCCKQQKNQPIKQQQTKEFVFLAERFEDLKIIRYKIPGFNSLSLKQKKLVYFLTQAAYSGREIIYDQNFRYGLMIKRALENIYTKYSGDKNIQAWKDFVIYLKRMWFSNGIFHHYSNDKFIPKFSKSYFEKLLLDTKTDLPSEVVSIIFSKTEDMKKVNLDTKKGLLLGSSINMYSPKMSAKQAANFYASKKSSDPNRPNEIGLNSKKLIKNGKVTEDVYKVGGLYGKALGQVVYWLKKAVVVAENLKQKKALELLIEYFQTGSLDKWTEYNIAWVEATEGDIDYILGFIEVYNDPLGYTGSFESIVQIKDFDMTKRMEVISKNAQYFENNSPIMDEHKKEKVVGISYKVVNVAGESGDASPSTPVGVNLPNNNWIRVEHGSKSVSLGNITYAYSQAGGSSVLEEFAFNKAEIERCKKYGKIAGKMHTALHEVIGHASGKLNPGVGTTKETLKNYSSILEEARADLVGLYFIPDSKLIKLGLFTSYEVAKTGYDEYLRNGLLTQLIRIDLGANIEQTHMRNRQLVSKWVLEKGRKDKVVELVKKDKKTYVRINDYVKLRELFGKLLREVQRIKSEGDYDAGRALVENYGVKVDHAIHKEVLERVKKFNIAPYGGFINPRLEAVKDKNGNITDVKVHYDETFEQQMLRYAREYSFL